MPTSSSSSSSLPKPTPNPSLSSSTAAKLLCCTNRVYSPELPHRPLFTNTFTTAGPTRTTTRRITEASTIEALLATAVLPQDHPHALKSLCRDGDGEEGFAVGGRVWEGIVKSPSWARKVRGQFFKGRFRKGEVEEEEKWEVEGEAVEMCEEGLSGLFGSREEDLEQQQQQQSRVGLERQKEAALEFGEAVWRSLENLRESEQDGASDLESPSARSSAGLGLPKSHSTPLLLSASALGELAELPRSRSEGVLGHGLPGPGDRVQPIFTDTCVANETAVNDLALRSTGHDDETPHTTGQQEQSGLTASAEHHVGDRSISTENEPHLHKMDISQQLRSMSQLSDLAEDDESLLRATSTHPWTFHLRERSDPGLSSGRGRHARQKSSLGVDTSNIPSARGEVRFPSRSPASSIYSRPASAGVACGDPGVNHAGPVSGTSDSPMRDWPLKSILPAADQDPSPKTTSLDADKAGDVFTTSLEDTRKDSGTASLVIANNDESASVKFLSPLPRATSFLSKSSSSSITKDSKRSNLLNRFSFAKTDSPPKKTVVKRRSIFKFLRPGSRKQQARSISSPVLRPSPLSLSGRYDGPSDDPALLKVQYELVEQSSQMARSMSMNQLATGHLQESSSHLTTSGALQRRPTLADYERNLSVLGDDRRRPSAIDINKVKEIQEEDDLRNSFGIRRRLSRAKPLRDDASPLMVQALEKHQQEKALFRSASKQRESLEGGHSTPLFASSSFLTPQSSLPTISQEDHSELLDPLEKGQFAGPSLSARRSISTGHLLPPHGRAHTGTRRSSTTVTSQRPQTIAGSAGPVLQAPEQRKATIGTALDSWSRYPSHTRNERCGSAGLGDAVITRDFAVDINHDDIHTSDDAGVGSPESKNSDRSASKSPRAILPKSRSFTFSGIVRYYSNLFNTSGFYGQNRRTSVTTGGRLEYPELEILPPQLPSEAAHHHSELFAHLREHVKDDAERLGKFVKKEEDRLEQYVEREEKKLEGFVEEEEGKLGSFAREEERNLERFVRKGEDKLMEYVQEEEDKLFEHRRSRPNHDGGSRQGSPFRQGSIFSTGLSPGQPRVKRRDTSIGPDDDLEKGLAYDGADETLLSSEKLSNDGPDAQQPLSKAEIWSDLYKACLARPLSADEHESAEKKALLCKQDADAALMPPPARGPIKPHASEQLLTLDPKASIRRFPSVTVIDDRKGHFRSVSLISVRSTHSAGFERSSTHDLLELIQAREREERGKLLARPGGHAHVDANGRA